MEIIGVIVLAVLLVLGVRVLLARQGRRLNRRIDEAVTPENARVAALALTDEQHREIYRAIAAEDGRRALASFKQATGASVKDCLIAVQALHRYPQRTPSELRMEDELSGASEGPQVHDELIEDTIDDVREDTGEDAGPDAGPDAGDAPSRSSGDISQDAGSEDRDDSAPLAEADPYTGRILGENAAGIPDIPGGDRSSEDEGSGGSGDEPDTSGSAEQSGDDAAADGSEGRSASRPGRELQGPVTGPADDSAESSSGTGAAGAEEGPVEDPEVEEKARRLLAESEFSLDDELTVPEEWTRQEVQEEPAGFHLEVQREGEKITLSHEDLEPWVHDQLYALLRDDHVDEAARLLADHSPLTRDEAHKFLVVFKNQG